MPGRGDGDSDLDDVEPEDEKSVRKKKELDSYDDDESEGEDDSDSISDEETRAGDEEGTDDETPGSKSHLKAKWEKRLVAARELFNEHANPYAFDLKFPRSGEAATFEIEVRLLPGNSVSEYLTFAWRYSSRVKPRKSSWLGSSNGYVCTPSSGTFQELSNAANSSLRRRPKV